MTTLDGQGTGTVRQAGAIVFRDGGGRPRILLVTALEHPEHWIFPKGHVEPGESPESAALREAREEAGVEGELVGYAGSLVFSSGGTPVSVDYFVVRLREQFASDERRRVRWCTYDEAQRLLTFDDAKRLLADALSQIERSAATDRGSRRAKEP